MEITEDAMVVMTTDCSFRRIEKKKNVCEGMEIEFNQSDIILDKKRSLIHFIAVAAAVLLIIVTSAFGFENWNLLNQSVALVTIDINPSLQLEMNYKNQVIKGTALNEDAEKISLDGLKGKPLAEVLEIILEQAKDKGYILHEAENFVLVTTVVLQQEKANSLEISRLIQAVKENIEEKALKEGEKIEIVAIDASEDMLLKANEQKVSVGRLQLYEEAKESMKEKTNNSAVQEMKIKELIEIRKETKLRKEHPVFENPPSGKSDKDITEEKKEHPVFDNHPSGNKDDIKQDSKEKEHPIFKDHPSNKKNSNESKEIQKQHPVFNESPNDNKNNKDKQKQEKELPAKEQPNKGKKN